MVQRVQVRTITNDEGIKLLRIVRRSSGSVVTWRRAQVVLLSARQLEVDRLDALQSALWDKGGNCTCHRSA